MLMMAIPDVEILAVHLCFYLPDGTNVYGSRTTV